MTTDRWDLATETPARWQHRNTADQLRRRAEGETGPVRAATLREAAAEFRLAELHGLASWCERHAERAETV